MPKCKVCDPHPWQDNSSCHKLRSLTWSRSRTPLKQTEAMMRPSTLAENLDVGLFAVFIYSATSAARFPAGSTVGSWCSVAPESG